MVWKSREDKAPPPQFFADVIGYLHHAFPGAMLTREAMEALAPHLIREWRHGQSARNAAKATCSCDGRAITVSPAAQVQLGRRSVLPPTSASRGQLFGIESLRERREIGALRVKAAVETRHAEYETARLAELKAEHARLINGGKAAKAAKLAEAVAATEKSISAHRANSAEYLQNAERLAHERGFWIPPAAQDSAAAAAAPKRSAKRSAPDATTKKSAAKPAAPKKSAPPATPEAPKKKCDQCTGKPSLEPDLSALVDEFVDAAMKDQGK